MVTNETTSEQVKKLLGILYPNMTDSDWSEVFTRTFTKDYAWSLRIRLDGDITLSDLNEALSECSINTSYVTLGIWYDHFCLEISNMEIGYELNFD